MPEGDTIHKLAAALQPRLEGKIVRRAWVRTEPRGTFKRGGASLALAPAPTLDDGGLVGQQVDRVHAQGKHPLFQFNHGLLVRSHLGMFGDWHRYRPGEPWKKPDWQVSLALWTDQDVFTCFNAKEVEFLEQSTIRHTNFSNRLGPDLASPTANLELAIRRARELHHADAPLVDLLLDQRVACGIGNVYKSEVLFIERQHPLRILGETADTTLQRLYGCAGDLLQRNLGAGPRITRFVSDGRGPLWVYGRRGKPCFRCGAEVSTDRLGRDMRTTYWCPACQIR